jgi:hypothetical protein
MASESRFTVRAKVRIASVDRLQAFRRDWKYHHPLAADQVPFGGTIDIVKSVGFYHGGDVIYVLERAPGIWHEELLESA